MSAPAAPRVSVVIPLYQKGLYVQRAVQSVLRQTLHDLEVIVVDDGSTDDALRRLGEVKDPRLVVKRQAQQGVSVARNRGISLASARWIAFLDADDEWLPTFLESTLRIAEACPGVAAVFSNLWDHPTQRSLISKISCQGSLVRDYFAALVDNEGIGMSSSSVLVSKAHLAACGAFSDGVKHYEDMDLWARLAWSGDVAFCADSLAIYHSEVPDSASKNVRAGITPYPAVLRTYEEWSAQLRIPERLLGSSRRYANWFLAWNVMELAHQGFPMEARQRLSHPGWRDHTYPLLWKAWLWTWLPTGMLQIGRWLLARLRHRRRLVVAQSGDKRDWNAR